MQHLFSRYFIVFYFLLPAAAVFSQKQQEMEVLTVVHGLPSNSVEAIFQDRQGFIWIGTEDGLARYDGYDFKVFRQRPGDSLGLHFAQVTELFEDREGLLWVGSPFGLSRYDQVEENFYRIPEQPKLPGALKNQVMAMIHEDKAGKLWFGTAGGGMFEYEHSTQKFRQYFPDTLFPNYAYYSIVLAACNDRQDDDRLWLSVRLYDKGKLYCFNTRNKQFTPFQLGEFDTGHSINGLIDDGKGRIWASTEHNVLIINKSDGQVQRLDAIGQLPGLRISGICQTADGTIWIGTYRSGLFAWHPEKKTLSHYDTSNGLPSNWVKKIIEDRSGVLWVGTTAGLVRWRREPSYFKTFVGDPSNPRFAVGGSITTVCEDKDERIWIGTSWRGMDCFDRKTSRYLPINFKPGDLRTACIWVFSMTPGQNRIWFGSNSRGIFGLDYLNNTYVNYTAQSIGLSDLGFNYIRALHEDRDGNLWAGTFAGLYRFDIANNVWSSYRKKEGDPSSLCHESLTAIFEDRSGNIWVGSQGGLSLFDRTTGQFRHFLYDPADSNQLRSGRVISVSDDRAGNIWVGTLSGLYRLSFKGTDRNQPTITHYSDENGLLRNRIHGIMEDGRGRLWISSTGGLSVLKNPQHDAHTPPDFQHYNERDGLQGYSFSPGGFFKNHKGEMYFAGENGFNLFHPDSIRDNPHIPPVFITALKKFDADRPEAGAIEVPGIALRKEITLSYKNNIIAISFAALDFREPSKNRYAYQLEGFSDAWVQLGSQHQVTFTNLDPGTYYFRVKGANNDGVWNEQPAVLKIIIRPPWYRSWAAYVAYFILIAGSIYGFYQFQLNRRLQLAEAERLKSLDEFKTRFFTNITHEFRTPLTVILGMVEQLSVGRLTTENAKNSLNAIKRSGENLLRLINQILDLAKLEDKSLHINYVQGDLLAYLRYISESLQSLANSQNLILRLESEHAKVIMDYDADRILQVVHNLVSNAIKFTPSGGKVTLRLNVESDHSKEKYALLTVQDTGVGISPEELPHLFDRFFQAKNQDQAKAGGTGIGLSLTRELVRAMGGDVWVESAGVKGKGATFFVRLPHRQTAEKAPALPDTDKIRKIQPAIVPPVSLPTGSADMPTLLLIEDNPDVVEYLQMCLAGHFQLDFAYNGRAGIERALETIPDLILSDVMMPEKDGFEVCDTLKNHELCSHIPFVLLTAKADVDSRIAGLRRGADAYLAKPFHQEELLLTLRNMLDLRKRLQARLGNMPVPAETPENESVGLAQENAFVQKVRTVVEAHLSDARFTVEDLCRDLAMSQSQLHRKLSALTGTNATLFIRSVRLQKARILLAQPDQTVSEVAYAVGFDDPKYFSRVFAEEFGVPPSKFSGV
ncbi:MAG: two-component regulator propeller domain-containing protein [Saprospiraceae bacterium]|nr:two-component regulator propeller domain-containing protein [Saprospiraceae bacterium]